MHANRSLLTFVLSPDNVRRLGPENAKEVEKLTLKNTGYLFGDTTVAVQLDRNFLSVGIFNESDELVGVLCLDTHPNIPALPPWEWDYWIHNMYGIDDLKPITTVWIHYAVWDRRYTSLFLKPLLQSVFLTYEPLENVLMVCPPGINRLDFIEDYATRVLPGGFSNPMKIQTLYITKKPDFVASYVIRRAVQEDNDDLVAIIPAVLEETYGHYYISELLSNEESTRQIIVAEHRGCAVGVLCLNENVNYDLLNTEFELVPYNGLKTYNDADEVGKMSPVASPTMPILAEDSNERLSTITLASVVKVEEAKVEEDNVSDDEFSLVNLSSSLILNFLYEEGIKTEDDGSSDSATSIESHFSAVVLNEEYEDHVYNSDRGEMAEAPEEKKVKRRDSKQDDGLIPSYFGEPNAFTMEICTSLPSHENCLYLLFQAAFECFPDRDYLVVSFPSDAKICYLQKHFARVVPRGHSVFNHELLVLHKNSILGKMWARPSHPQDKRYVSDMITTVVKPGIIEEAFKEAVDVPKSGSKAYTFLCDKQIIGCAIVTEEAEHEYLSLHYDVDPWLEFKGSRFGVSGSMEQFLLSPIFERHTRFFLRELHRMSDFQVLLYRLRCADAYAHHANPMLNCITSMVSILPHPVPEYSKQIREEFQLPSCLRVHHQAFGLYLSTTRLASTKRLEIHHKIVVVGAGATTISFLERLIFGLNPHHLATFANITVISPHGVVYHKQPSKIREMVFVSDGHLDRRYMDSICLKTYVHVVQGVMTSINRKEKYIALNDDTQLPYDYLFLMCGEQFQKTPSKKKEVVKRRMDFPQNVFIINTEADAGNAFNALKNLHAKQKQGHIVVFGHYLEACCCLAALLEFGVPGGNLSYVDPCPDHVSRNDCHDHLTQFFNNAEVETAVLDEILLQGVTVYQDYNFVEWHLDSTKNFITSAKFESKYKFIELELSALFIYHSKGVSARTFQAIARSGLVFNGRLVIDKNCQTNDPCIYGAGPLTMYSKKYHAEHLMHRYYNPQEIGSNLGQEFRKKLVLEEYWDPPTKTPRFRKPVVQHCRFPGNLHYLQVSKPGQPVPLDVAMIKCNYGKVITTGDCKKLHQCGFFRLHLNQFQTVETITCLAKFELPVQNLINLWGKHQVLLNHLSLRYDLGMIPDLFEFFDQAWAAALYHRDFARVMDEIYEMLSSEETPEGTKLIDEVRSLLEKNEWSPLTKMQLDEIEEVCRDSNVIRCIQQRVASFLHDTYMYLPMYAHQLLIRWIIHQTHNSPLFVKATLNSEDDVLAGLQSGKGYMIPTLQRYKYAEKNSES